MLVKKQSATRILIDVLRGKRIPQADVDVLIGSAFKNKVVLHLLRVLNIQGSLRERQESGIRRVIKVVQVISKLTRETY